MTQGTLFDSTPGSTEPKAGTQKAKILSALRRGGPLGVSNVTLNSIAFRYAARIHELRTDHHFNIGTGPTLANGTVLYWLNR